MAQKVMVNGTVREIDSGKELISGTVHKKDYGKVLVGGTVRKITYGKSISSLPVGSTTEFYVGGKKRKFIIVHQGLPSSLYDNSCNGTWLMQELGYDRRSYGQDNNYATSDVSKYLSGEFFNSIEEKVRRNIKKVKIPYTDTHASTDTVMSSASGAQCTAFLLSAPEIGISPSDNANVPGDGSKLDYFLPGVSTDASIKRYMSSFDGMAATWITRSPRLHIGSIVHAISYSGTLTNMSVDSNAYIRPAFILDQSTLIDEQGNII